MLAVASQWAPALCVLTRRQFLSPGSVLQYSNLFPPMA